MVYRKRVEFAVGHGIAVHAKTADEDSQKGVEIRTVVMPEYEVQVTESPGLDSRDRTAMRELSDSGFMDMERLAELSRTDLVAALNILKQDYDRWIAEQEARIPDEFGLHECSQRSGGAMQGSIQATE